MKNEMISAIELLKPSDSYVFSMCSENGSIVFESGDTGRAFIRMIERELDNIEEGQLSPVDVGKLLMARIELIINNWADNE